MHDHVDVDAGIGERREDGCRLTRAIGDPHHRDLGIVEVSNGAGDDRLFHDVSLIDTGREGFVGQNEGALTVGE